MSKSSSIGSMPKTDSYFGSLYLYMALAAVCFTAMGILTKQAGLKFAMHEYELVFWRVLFATAIAFGYASVLFGGFFNVAFKANAQSFGLVCMINWSFGDCAKISNQSTGTPDDCQINTIFPRFCCCK